MSSQIDDLAIKGLTDFLEECQGFSSLPQEKLKEVALHLSLEFHPKGSHLFEENQSKVEGVYLLLDGRGEKTWQNEKLPHLDRPTLERGEVFGAFSILLNEGYARRSLHLLSDCFFYRMAEDFFLKLCSEHPDFKTHFTSHLSAGVHRKSLRGRSKLPLLEAQGNERARDMANESVIRVRAEVSIRTVTALILEKQGSIAIVETDENPLWGLVTYRTLSESVILKGVDPEDPVELIAVRDVLSVAESTPLFQSLLFMAQHEVHHLPLVDTSGAVSSILSSRDMPQMQGGGVLSLMASIRKTKIARDLRVQRERLVELAQDMHHRGFSPNMVSQFIARSNDAIVARVVELAMEKEVLPCPFTFLVFGSEGRDEQTLVVDQDNGIVFDPQGQDPDELRPAFLEFGRKVCETLDFIGYPHCKGGVMASEDGCCRSLEEWTSAFRDWVDSPEPESVLKAQIYFDLKPVLGEHQIAEKLMANIHDLILNGGETFLHRLAIEVIRSPVPLGFFQNIILSTDREHREKVDLKNIQNLFVDPLRLLALKHGVDSTNTMERLDQLHENKVLKTPLCEDIRHAYENILHLRLLTQEQSLKEGGEGSNYLKPDSLGDMDQRVLKAVLILAQNIQRKIQRDFDVAAHSL